MHMERTADVEFWADVDKRRLAMRAPNAFAVDDIVSWNFRGRMVKGKVVEVIELGRQPDRNKYPELIVKEGSNKGQLPKAKLQTSYVVYSEETKRHYWHATDKFLAANAFSLGDHVAWTTESGKGRSGEVVEIIKAGSTPSIVKYPFLYAGGRKAGPPRPEDSVVVKFDGSDKMFAWPHAPIPFTKAPPDIAAMDEGEDEEFGKSTFIEVTAGNLSIEESFAQLAKEQDSVPDFLKEPEELADNRVPESDLLPEPHEYFGPVPPVDEFARQMSRTANSFTTWAKEFSKIWGGNGESTIVKDNEIVDLRTRLNDALIEFDLAKVENVKLLKAKMALEDKVKSLRSLESEGTVSLEASNMIRRQVERIRELEEQLKDKPVAEEEVNRLQKALEVQVEETQKQNHWIEETHKEQVAAMAKIKELNAEIEGLKKESKPRNRAEADRQVVEYITSKLYNSFFGHPANSAQIDSMYNEVKQELR